MWILCLPLPGGYFSAWRRASRGRSPAGGPHPPLPAAYKLVTRPQRDLILRFPCHEFEIIFIPCRSAVKDPTAFIKPAALLCSILLLAGFISFRAGAWHRI